MATEPPYEISKEQWRSQEIKGATLEGGPECMTDTHTQGRYQEVTSTWRYAKCKQLKRC